MRLYVVKPGSDGWRWRLLKDDQPLADSPGPYPTVSDCLAAIILVQEASSAPVHVCPEASSRTNFALRYP